MSYPDCYSTPNSSLVLSNFSDLNPENGPLFIRFITLHQLGLARNDDESKCILLHRHLLHLNHHTLAPDSGLSMGPRADPLLGPAEAAS